jgi:hypothetical protein
MPNPPIGAALTYHVRETLPDDVQLVANILNAQGTQVRRITLTKTAGLHRTMWNLAQDPGVPGAGRGNDGTADAVEAAALADQQQPPPPPPPAGRGAGGAGGAPQGGGRGGGGGGGGAQAPDGRYRIVIGKLVGETFTQIGPAQFVNVVALPAQNYILYR